MNSSFTPEHRKLFKVIFNYLHTPHNGEKIHMVNKNITQKVDVFITGRAAKYNAASSMRSPVGLSHVKLKGGYNK